MLQMCLTCHEEYREVDGSQRLCSAQKGLYALVALGIFAFAK